MSFIASICMTKNSDFIDFSWLSDSWIHLNWYPVELWKSFLHACSEYGHSWHKKVLRSDENHRSITPPSLHKHLHIPAQFHIFWFHVFYYSITIILLIFSHCISTHTQLNQVSSQVMCNIATRTASKDAHDLQSMCQKLNIKHTKIALALMLVDVFKLNLSQLFDQII